MFWLLAAPLAAAFLGGRRLGWTAAAVVAAVGAAFFAAAGAYAFPHGLTPEDAAVHHLLNFVSVAAFVSAIAWLYESPTIQHLRTLSRQLAAANAELHVELAARQQAQARAEEASHAKSVLLDNMSHEFRTPIAAILGCAEVLTDEANADQQEFLGLIDRGARRLLATLDGVLELAWIESGGGSAPHELLDVAATVREVAEPLRPLALAKGLAFDVASEAAEAVADVPCLQRLVGVLVDNAVKFTERGRVTITVRREAGSVLVEVSDTGVGIDPAFLPHLFTAFRQESEGYGRQHEGAGVGLAVAHGLARQLGAVLTVEGQPGLGSVFTLRLPMASAASEPAARQQLPGMRRLEPLAA